MPSFMTGGRVSGWRGRGSRAGGRLATRLAAWGAPRTRASGRLAQLNRRGYISPRAQIACPDLRLGEPLLRGRRRGDLRPRATAATWRWATACTCTRGPSSSWARAGASRSAQAATSSPNASSPPSSARCSIGREVQVAPACAFYPYEHGIAAGQPIHKQPLQHPGRHRDRRRRLAGLRGDRAGGRDHRPGRSRRRGRGRDPRRAGQPRRRGGAGQSVGPPARERIGRRSN